MSYVVESGASRSRRARRRRALITLAIVVLMLFFAFWYAYSYYRESGSRAATPQVSCTTTSSALLVPSKITVNVYNATDRSGLAARTAGEVRKRGFNVSTVSNDPLQKKIAIPAEVRHGPTGAAGSKVVLRLVKGAKAVRDSRTDASVDLVLGNKFTALTPVPKSAPTGKPAPTPSSKPVPSPVPKPASTPTPVATC